MAGCTRWHQLRSPNGTGLFMPPAVAQATRDFEEANDHVVEFIKACRASGCSASLMLAAGSPIEVVSLRGCKCPGSETKR
jgi:hypothetical protein